MGCKNRVAPESFQIFYLMSCKSMSYSGFWTGLSFVSLVSHNPCVPTVHSTLWWRIGYLSPAESLAFGVEIFFNQIRFSRALTSN